MRMRARRFVASLVHGSMALSLALGLALGAARCSRLNPLLPLQSGVDRDAIDDEDGPRTDSETGTGADGEVDADVDGGPGCGPARWSECGVTIAATTKQLGSAILFNGDVYFTDEGTGEVLETHCTGTECSKPVARAAGEDMPRNLAAESDSLFWTTRAAIRRLKIIPNDAATPVDTLDTASGTADLAATYPNAAWADDAGVRAWAASGTTSVWSKPASPLVMGNAVVYFVSENEVKRCRLDVVGTQCQGGVAVLPGTAGATTIFHTTLFSDLFHLPGVVAALPMGTGSRLELPERLDDAGAPIIVADDPSTVRSLAASGPFLYWTTASGELRRRAADSETVTTLLRGLSADTRIAGDDSLIVIADRGANKLLTYAH
jgi:hypothetical protein